jgi:hypothetical protein
MPIMIFSWIETRGALGVFHISSGMALSFTAMISLRTSAAFWILSGVD